MKQCKCGDKISEKAIALIITLPLKQLNIPDYQRCFKCVRILSDSVNRLISQEKRYRL